MSQEIVSKTAGLTEFQIDALREIGTIGAGHAATALSKIIGRKVVINVPRVNIVKIEQAPDFVTETERRVTGVYFKLTGDIPGSALVLYSMRSACMLIDIVSGKTEGSTKSITTELEESTLMEVGNVVIGSYITALGTMTGLVVLQSIPYIAKDTLGAIFNSVLAEVGLTSDIALMIEIEFIEASKKVKGYIYMLPDIESSGKILDALGLK